MAATIIPPVFTVISTGPLFINPVLTIVRPGNTTAYASGQLVANSTTAGLVTVPFAQASRLTDGSFSVSRVKIQKTNPLVSGAAFRVHLFSILPVPTVGDGTALATSGSLGYLGSFDVTVSQIFTDGSVGFSDNTVRAPNVTIPGSSTVYTLLEARGAYTPISGETFNITLEVTQG